MTHHPGTYLCRWCQRTKPYTEFGVNASGRRREKCNWCASQPRAMSHCEAAGRSLSPEIVAAHRERLKAHAARIRGLMGLSMDDWQDERKMA